MPPSPHRYFLAWPDSSSTVLELDGTQWQPHMPPEIRYPLAVFAEAEACMKTSGLHFYLTKDPYRLPEYGPHVVAVLLQEERCKIPSYARHVHVVVRNLQTDPYIGFRPHAHMGRLEGVLLMEYLRDLALHLRSQRQLATFHAPGANLVRKTPLVLTIPLGYHSQQQLPLVPMRERTLDTFFAGDIHADFPLNDYRRWLSTAKILARRQCWWALEALKTTRAADGSAWEILLNDLSAEKAASNPAAYSGYSERMQQSRICLAPRGSVAETFRFYEGLRAGCLVITNRLPAVPFLSGAPVLFVDHWREVSSLFQQYARNYDALEEFGAAGRRWWKEQCSEQLIAQSVAAALDQPA